jgi:ubiquinone biosynthesis protein COQ4
MNVMNAVASNHIRPIEIARSLYGVLQDPDDTSQVFRLFDAVSGRGPNAFTRRFERSRTGAELLVDRPDILARLRDTAGLANLPEGSLGRAYLAFMQRDGLTPDWLVKASEDGLGDRRGTAAHDYIANRMRDTHDLWHVVTGYGGDLLGEASLLAFTFAQTFAAGIGLLVSVGLVRADDPDARRLIVDGFARGARAAWLPAVRWEELLDRPLEEVRAKLRVGAPPSYQPFFARDLGPGALLRQAA